MESAYARSYSHDCSMLPFEVYCVGDCPLITGVPLPRLKWECVVEAEHKVVEAEYKRS